MNIRLNTLPLAFIALALFISFPAQAEDSAPAFLNYAQQQEKQATPPPPKVSKPARASTSPNTTALQKKLAAQKSLISEKEKTIRQLQMQLKSQHPAPAPAPARENNAANREIEQLKREITTLTSHNQQLSQQARAAQQEKTDNAGKLDTSAARLQAQMAKFNALEAEKKSLSDKLTMTATEKQQLSVELAAEKAKTATAAKIPTLNLSKAVQQQAYSVGVSIGQDALKTLTSQSAQGLKLEQPTVLRGINDVLAGKLALDEQTRNKALFDVSQRLYKNIDKLEQQTIREGKKYQQQFAAQKGVQLKDGVYSRVDYPGKGKIGASDMVTVVIKESLIDGTVINDMEAEDKVWTQTLSKYPPTFREPLKRLNNHGAITIVVPQERAYGSKGVPGKIPPGATMVYTVRIVDAEPNRDQPTKASAPVATR